MNSIPEWSQYFSQELLTKAISSEPLRQLMKKAERDYVYWDKFRRLPMPEGFKPEQAWAFLKFSRLSNREATPARSENGVPFSYTITKKMYHDLSQIDANTSGFLGSVSGSPSATERNRLIISGLMEEAIASSQIEGANTSRRAAKNMLLAKRKARTKDEQMIVNNYQVMERLLEWKDIPLSLDIILDIQKNITHQTLEDPADEGRWRNELDDIVVGNRLTGETVFTPPAAAFVAQELQRLIEYANNDQEEDDFIHPVVKASILHFWVAYLHPFVDGNGRTARAIFYWYLLKNDYWMFQYLSVSRIIKKSKKQYDAAYIHTEHDGNDLTYFLIYKLRAILLSIEDLIKHYREKEQKERAIEGIARKLRNFNERQIALLQYLQKHKDATLDIVTHQSKYGITYQTARTDLLELAEKNLLTMVQIKKKYVFIPRTTMISKLLAKGRNIE